MLHFVLKPLAEREGGDQGEHAWSPKLLLLPTKWRLEDKEKVGDIQPQTLERKKG